MRLLINKGSQPPATRVIVAALGTCAHCVSLRTQTRLKSAWCLADNTLLMPTRSEFESVRHTEPLK
jgi:hypothetical protein